MAGCSPVEGGPLRGPRLDEVGDLEICLPASPEGTGFFGEPLRNAGDDPITILSIQIVSGENYRDVTFGIDTEGPEQDQLLGAFHWPVSPESIDYIDEVMARISAPGGVVIEPGRYANFIIGITSLDSTREAVVFGYEIEYESRGRRYMEENLVVHRLSNQDAC